MQVIDAAKNRIDAQRFLNFLARHEIDATIRESAVETDGPESNAGATAYAVWVGDGEREAARGLVGEFESFIDDATDDSIDDEQAAVGLDPSSERKPPVRGVIPWLTISFCLACIALSIGLQGEPNPKGPNALKRWGSLDGVEIVDGSYWGVVSLVFLHATVSHLVGNLVGTAILGAGIERACGRLWWLLLFVAGALVTAAAELSVIAQVYYGASGIVGTFFGFTLVASARKRLIAWWLLALLSIWLLYGAVIDLAAVIDSNFGLGVDITWAAYAHLSGLGLGTIAALAFVISWQPRFTRPALAMILLAALVPVLHGPTWLPDWCFAKADRALQTGNIASAIDWYTKAIDRSREPAAGYVSRAWAYLDCGDLDAAWTDLESAHEADPELSDLAAFRALLRLYNSDLEGAMDDVRHEMDRASASAYAYDVRGRVRLAQGQFGDAQRDFEAALRLEPRNAAYWMDRASVRLMEDRHEQALSNSEHALQLDANESSALLVRGMAFSGMARYENARAELQHCCDLLHEELARRPNTVWLHSQLAEALLTQFDVDGEPGRLDEAMEHSRQFLHSVPRYWEAWSLQGAILLEQKQYGPAEQHLSRALELNPRDSWALCDHGLVRHGLDRTVEGLLDLDQAIAINPRFSFAYRSRGLMRQTLGRLSEALADFDRALELNPLFAEAYQLRAQVHEALGETQAARSDRQQAIELDPRLERSPE
ncbi:MAG: rhomboid family intramembrane serine protease [Planctomycetaceae bacterium]|nr:rhomboid family intramembrane serine protease [Planctomycetaceae bacterium]